MQELDIVLFSASKEPAVSRGSIMGFCGGRVQVAPTLRMHDISLQDNISGVEWPTLAYSDSLLRAVPAIILDTCIALFGESS